MTGSRMRCAICAPFLCLLPLVQVTQSLAHHEHSGPTYEVTEPVEVPEDRARLLLEVVDGASGGPTAARFSLVVDGVGYTPDALGAGGLRFVTIHQSKHQRFAATYTRGTGEVAVPLPDEARRGVVSVVKGFEYFPQEIPFEVVGSKARVAVTLSRMSNLKQQGWTAAEGHLHYDRLNPEHDPDWLTLLAGDDLVHAHFMVVKGGNLPGVWAEQFAYGRKGEAFDGHRLIRPGEEYRDGIQGHINLLGVTEIIKPISSGRSDHRYHYPAFYDVLQRARELEGIVGPAHGTALGRSPTGVADTVLGAVDFMEIANTHLYKVDVWYRLMNCGYIVPPSAGTDLPNFPFREPWQPLLGETRMYVRTGGRIDFESWKEAVRAGRVFVTSGPMIELAVDDAGPGDTIRLSADGGEVQVSAVLSSPHRLETLELVVNGEPVETCIERQLDGRVHRLRLRRPVKITESCWLAARGFGVPKEALAENTGIQQKTFAHTAAVKVLVGDAPIFRAEDARFLIDHLVSQKKFYDDQAKYENDADRRHAQELFDRAITALQRTAHQVARP